MAFTSGVTSKGVGPIGGLLEAVVNFITDKPGISASAESIGSPNGVLVTFSGTLSNVDVKLDSLVVDYVIGTTPYQGISDAAGLITGTNISSGSISADGTYSITFTSAPDNASALTVDYTHTYIPGRDWVLQVDQNAKSNSRVDTVWGSDTREVVLSNTGLGNQDNVIFGIREWKRPSTDAYGWNLNGYAAVPADNDWNESVSEHGLNGYHSQADNWGSHPTIQMFDGIVAYWIYSNKQRVIIQIRCASDYYCCYLGLGNRFDPPSEYPNPLIIAGTCCGAKPFANNNCLDGGDGGWSPVRPYKQDYDSIEGPEQSNGYESTLMVVQANGQFQYRSENQRHIPMDGRFGIADWGDTFNDTAINDNVVIDAAKDGSYMMLPAYILMPDGSELGFDGMRILRKNNISSEDTRTDSATGDVWRLFQSGSNTAASAWHAIKEE